jgi:Trk-type K+ transport system membrane component
MALALFRARREDRRACPVSTVGEDGMKGTRSRLVRVVVLWTVFMLAIAIALAAEAVMSLNRAEQACFMNFPATPCPGSDDPAVVRLTLAFVGVPLGWLIGLGVVGLAWSLIRRQASRHRGVRS